VFVQKDDAAKPLCDVRTTFRKALGASGISGFTFHDLRHTAASYMVMRGVDLRTVQDILGHKDLRMTMRYSHLCMRSVRWLN
jgi:integrase